MLEGRSKDGVALQILPLIIIDPVGLCFVFAFLFMETYSHYRSGHEVVFVIKLGIIIIIIITLDNSK